jgi:hypothetical protein
MKAVWLRLFFLFAAASYGLAQDPQSALAGSLSTYDGHLGAHSSAAQVIADANSLTGGYRGLSPYVGRFGPSDYAQNRVLARRTFSWLSRAGALYGSDPAVMRALAGTYGYLGGFYGNAAFSSYPYAAVTAWAGANRVTRSMYLSDRNNRGLESELQRLGLAWAAAAYVGGRFYGEGLPDTADLNPSAALAAAVPTVPVPEVDASKLTPDQAAQWTEVRQRFVLTAGKVHDARVLLEQLGARLQSQNMSLNSVDVAAALMMQGFLDDAATLAQSGKFELAKEALVRAEYQRRKLKDVIGQ